MTGGTATPPTKTDQQTTTERPVDVADAQANPWAERSWLPSELTGFRARILSQFVLLLALALIGSIWIVREVLSAQAEEQISAELAQEVAELRSFAKGNDPETGRPFTGVRPLFRAFLASDVPAKGEMALAFVAGQPFLYAPRDIPYRLDRDNRLVARWGDLEVPDRGFVGTPEGPVDYAAVPVRTGSDVEGLYVIAVFRDVLLEDVQDVVRAVSVVAGIALLIASVLAWRLAQGVLVRVSRVTKTARTISDKDLSQRMQVEGRDEIAQLAETFNEMLDRLEVSFATQRAFIDDAGHELRTPLTIISGHLDLLEDDPEERRETLNLVMDELDRMARIVGDLLVLAKAERRDFLQLAGIEIGSFAEEVYRKISAISPRRWVLESSGQGEFVGDRHRLTQALVQLAQNAVQHTSEDDVVALGAQLDEGAVYLWIRDSGAGVAKAERERIFRRFARGSGTRRSEGAGLGLPIVGAIATAHAGRLELESEEGRGAKFTLVLPRRNGSENGEEA